VLDVKLGNGEPNSFKANEHGGCVLVSVFGTRLMVSDVDMVRDIFTTKNKFIDKTDRLDV
jgi:hypothetical protein